MAVRRKATMSAHTFPKLRVFWSSGMASTKHTGGVRLEMRAHDDGVSSSRLSDTIDICRRCSTTRWDTWSLNQRVE